MAPDDDGLYPDLAVLCTGCHAALEVPDGVNALDVAWLHELRCPRPAYAVCPSCDAALALEPGLDAVETVWLHEDQCPASIVFALAG
ncbi:MAG TPA: hypothetical protein VFF06_23960 [Polyangia bacterium]|nr:hypothetical protein [Polyangia bacterium]